MSAAEVVYLAILVVFFLIVLFYWLDAPSLLRRNRTVANVTPPVVGVTLFMAGSPGTPRYIEGLTVCDGDERPGIRDRFHRIKFTEVTHAGVTVHVEICSSPTAPPG